MKRISIFLSAFFLYSLLSSYKEKRIINEAAGIQVQMDTTALEIPLGGNSFITVKDKSQDRVSNDGWKNWRSEKTVFSTYVKTDKAGSLQVAIVVKVPSGESKIRCTIEGVSKTIVVTGEAAKEYVLGNWKIKKPGYVKIDIQGISKSGDVFAETNKLLISGSTVNEKTVFVKNNEGNYFYWGRRGPSVHLNYDIAQNGDEIEWFYNEIVVPEGNDPVGSYFMANGFGEGYFGMQVNSATERRILFSVWSPFETDDPSKIPDDKKIKLLKKGTDVHAGEFGNEGSGGQSYLKYNWKAGSTCKFLLKGVPAENNYTNYTAYFFDDVSGKWLLIASFSRPGTHTYLKRLHSFLENFDPSTGYITRKAFYQNQWTRDKDGNWKPVSKMKFTADATARKGYRVDYSGGEDKGRFFLQNCGFFDEATTIDKQFSHAAATVPPVIDFSALD